MQGMNPRMMKQAMQRMGIRSEEIEALEVVIRCSDREIVIHHPSVSKVNMMGQNTFQIVGEAKERSLEVEISDEDVATVIDQTGVSREEARAAIEKHHGDLAAAILMLKK